jgi:hypothetical protein
MLWQETRLATFEIEDRPGIILGVKMRVAVPLVVDDGVGGAYQSDNDLVIHDLDLKVMRAACHLLRRQVPRSKLLSKPCQ